MGLAMYSWSRDIDPWKMFPVAMFSQSNVLYFSYGVVNVIWKGDGDGGGHVEDGSRGGDRHGR